MTEIQEILKLTKEDILKDLGALSAPSENQTAIMDAIEDYFEKIILETILLNIGEKEKEKLGRAAIQNQDLENEIRSIRKNSPEIETLVREAVIREYELLKKTQSH